jgi:DNA-binding MarR family transcriptional regulator
VNPGAIRLTSGGVTKVIDRLEEQKLIARRYGSIKDDRRGTRLVLTSEGASVAAELAEGLASQMEAVRDAIRELGSLTRAEPIFERTLGSMDARRSVKVKRVRQSLVARYE